MLLVGIGTAVAQQAVGIDAIQYFLVYILDESGIKSRSAQMGILIALGLIKLAVIVLAGHLFDRKGRRPLLFVSLIGMSVSLLLVSMGFVGNANGAGFAVFGLALYLAFFSLGKNHPSALASFFFAHVNLYRESLGAGDSGERKGRAFVWAFN